MIRPRGPVLAVFLIGALAHDVSGQVLVPTTARQASGSAMPTIAERLDRVRTDVFTRRDRLDAAARELRDLLALDPLLAEAHLLLGLTHTLRNTPEMHAEAVAEFRQALDLAPGLTPARFYLARTYMETGQVERARDELQRALVDLPGTPQFLAVLGEVERRLGHPDRALDNANRALAAEPTLSEARYYRGLALVDLGRRDEAIAEFEQVVTSGVDRVEVILTLGATYLDAGRLEPAIAMLSKGLAIGPPTPDAAIYLARAYRLKGNLLRAQQQLDLALPPGAAMQASVRYQRLDAEVSLEQGLIHLARGRLVLARQSISKALEIEPGLGKAHRYLAEVHVRQARYTDALNEARLAREAGEPVPEELARAIEAALAAPAKGSAR